MPTSCLSGAQLPVFDAAQVLIFAAAQVLIFAAAQVLIFVAAEVLVFTTAQLPVPLSQVCPVPQSKVFPMPQLWRQGSLVCGIANAPCNATSDLFSKDGMNSLLIRILQMLLLFKWKKDNC